MAENSVTPKKARDFALATTLLEPPRFSAYHRRQQALSLATAALAAAALGLLIGRLWSDVAAEERLKEAVRGLLE